VPRLLAVCQVEASSPHPANSTAREEIHTCACGHCGSSASISRGVLLPLHHGGQVHQMAGGGIHQVHHSPAVCGHIHCHMGGKIGVPAAITSDQGRQLTSALWTGLHKRLEVQLVNTTDSHPQRTGMVERCHGQLKAALRERLARKSSLGLRPAPKEDSTISSACPGWSCWRRSLGGAM
jgi:hypothetical protein